MILKQEKPSQNQVQFSKKQEKIEQVPYYAINNNCSSAKANESSQELEYSNQTSHTVFNINSLAQSSPSPDREKSRIVRQELFEQISTRLDILENRNQQLSNDNKQLHQLLQKQDKNFTSIINHLIQNQKILDENTMQLKQKIETQDNLIQQLLNSQSKSISNYNQNSPEQSVIGSQKSQPPKSTHSRIKSQTPHIIEEVSTKLIKQQSSRVSHRDGTPSSLQKKQKTLSNSSRLGQKQIREGNSSAKKNIGQGLNHKSYSENFETVNFQTVATNINSSSNNMQQIYHKQKMKNVNNFNDSISEDVSMDHINESPSVKNLDDQNPKLLDHIKETLTLRLPNQIESCEITIDELEQRIRNSMEVFNSRQNDDEEDLGDIQQEDIEENHPKQAHKNLQMIDANSNEKTKDLHNHLSNYSSIASGKAQFTPHSKPQISLIQSQRLMSYREIILQKGSKCSCQAFQYVKSPKSSQKPKISNQNSKIKINETITLQQKTSDQNHSSDKCGPYCKNLTAQEQKYIIKQLMRKQAEQNGIEEKSLRFVNQSHVGQVGDRKYLICSQWWRKWCDFANFGEAMDQPSVFMSNQSIPSEIHANNILKNTQTSKDFSQYASGNVYDKPGIITNKDLLKDGRNNILKENLIEHYDYEAVSQQVWNHLYSWYSADWCISREIRKDKFSHDKIFLDLYPESNLDDSEMESNQEYQKFNDDAFLEQLLRKRQ